MKSFVTLKNGIYSIEYVVEKSKFVAFACHVDTIGQANLFVEKISNEHRDANHNCFAFLAEQTEKCSDDKEPQGTAGVPILKAIKAKQLTNVAVVVTRYFGGIKLGVGGLIRAYTKATNLVLDIAEKELFELSIFYEFHLPYSVMTMFQNSIKTFGETIEIVYLSEVQCKVAIHVELSGEFEKYMSNLLQSNFVSQKSENFYKFLSQKG